MFKKIIGCFCLLLSITSAYADVNEELIEYSHTFKSNQSESFSNPFFWSVDIQCFANLTDETATFHARVNDSSGTVNGHRLKKGEEITMSVVKGQPVNVSADAWASVEVTNVSSFPVKVTCRV